MYLFNPEDCLSCTVYIRRRNVGASLVEINEGMTEIYIYIYIYILDKQVYTQNENLKINIPGFTQALVKCAVKIK